MDPSEESAAIKSGSEAPHPIDLAIDEWFRGIAQNSVMSRSTEVYNHIHGALADLKARLKELVK